MQSGENILEAAIDANSQCYQLFLTPEKNSCWASLSTWHAYNARRHFCLLREMASTTRRLHVPLAQFHAQHTFNNGQVFGWFAAEATVAAASSAGPAAPASPIATTSLSQDKSPAAGSKAAKAKPKKSQPPSPIRISLSSERQPSFDSAAFHGVLGCWPWAAQASVQGVAPGLQDAPGPCPEAGALITVHSVMDAFTGEAVPVDAAVAAALRSWLECFLRAPLDFAPLQAQWCERDPPLQAAVDNFPGMRVLQQDVWECLLCFLCSSNNNIPRIRQMLAALRRRYGRPFPPAPTGTGATLHPECSHSMPCITALAAAPEADLRSLGLGYRAKFIRGTAQRLLDAQWREGALPTAVAAAAVAADADRGIKAPRKKRPRSSDDAAPPTAAAAAAAAPKDVAPQTTAVYSHQDEMHARAFLNALRGQPADVVQGVLVQLPGVGRKVADCVGLFSCGASGAVPVDTHVWKIAQRELDPALQEAKSITPRIYRRVGQLFREKYGEHAGWAHSWLFAREIAK